MATTRSSHSHGQHRPRQRRPAGPVRLEVSGLTQGLRPRPGRLRPELHRRTRARSPASSARTAPGRPRPCGWSSGSCTPTPGRRRSTARPTRDLNAPAAHRGRGARDRFHPARTGRNHLRVYCRAAGFPLARATRCSTRSASPRPATAAPAATRSACASGSRWPPRCSATPPSSCSTSRPTAWTPRASSGCAASSAPRPRAGPHDPGVEPSAVRGRADRRPRRHRRRRPTGAGGLDGAAPLRRRRGGHGPRPRPRWPGSPTCSAPPATPCPRPTAPLGPGSTPAESATAPLPQDRAARAAPADQRPRGDLLPAHRGQEQFAAPPAGAPVAQEATR